eukprot:1436659-Rhodomonas_salina.2
MKRTTKLKIFELACNVWLSQPGHRRVSQSQCHCQRVHISGNNKRDSAALLYNGVIHIPSVCPGLSVRTGSERNRN